MDGNVVALIIKIPFMYYIMHLVIPFTRMNPSRTSRSHYTLLIRV